MNLFKRILSFNGYPIDKASVDIARIKRLDGLDFVNWVEEKRKQQFDFFCKHNKFYQNIVKQIQHPIDFNNSPILTKQMLQVGLDNLLSSPFTNTKLFKNNTSGSSGTPFFFAKDKYAHAMTWALIQDRYSWYGIEHGVSLQARFYGIPLTGINFYKNKIKDWFASRERFPVFDLSNKRLDEFIKRFATTQFVYINGYTSALVYFAQYCIENNIVLNQVCPSLEVCFPTSEMCTDIDKRTIEKGFGVRVAVEYGCAEMDIIAFEDKEGDWLISNENIYVEIVDDDDNKLPDGQEGRIVLTSLHNKAIPLYRYDIGDIGIIDPVRKGKYQLLKKLTGRTNEFAILPSGRKVPALTFYYITKTLIQEQYRIKEFVIKQISTTRFLFQYVSDRELSDEAKLAINNAMATYLETGLESAFEKVSTIQRGKTGKLKQFIRQF
jgi:phenylacetate-CoA ligase